MEFSFVENEWNLFLLRMKVVLGNMRSFNVINKNLTDV